MGHNQQPSRLRFGLETKVTVSTRQLVSAISGLVLFAGVIFTINSNEAPLDDVFFSLDVNTEITVCDEAGTFTIEYVNGHVEPLTNQALTLAFPEGISYVTASLTDTSGYNVIEDDISDLSRPVFAIDNLEPGGMLSFTVKYSASSEARDFILSGKTPRNYLKLSSTQGVAIDSTDAYNVLYPSLSILSVNPTSQLIHTNDTTTRSFNITNGGYGRISSFYLTDLHGDGINWIASNVGQLNASGDTLWLRDGDFASIGNGDNYLDSYETIGIVQSFVGSGCNDATVSSVLNTHWACSGEWVVGTSTNAHITVNLKLPNLSLSHSQSLASCFDSSTQNSQSISLNNTGQGTAYQVDLTLFKSAGSGYEEDIFSKIDPNSITYQWGDNGSPQSISPIETSTTQSSGDYACLGSNPIGKVQLDLPDIPAGEKLVVKFYTEACCINICQNQRNSGWRYTVDYNDACEQNPTTSTKTGQSPLDANLSVFTESPSDIRDGQTERFHYTVSSHTNEYPKGPGARYEVVFTIPQGLKWREDPADLEWHSGLNTWNPVFIQYDSISRQLSAAYEFDAPFQLPKSELFIDLSGECYAGAVTDHIDLGLDINFIADTSCSQNCSMPILCSQTVSVHLHCPGACSEGLAFKSYEIDRISFGQPDNDQDGKADSNGSLAMSSIKTNRAMVGDSLRGSFFGTVHTSSSFPAWAYGYASSTIEMGSNLSVYKASIRVYDASAGTYLNCDEVAYSSTLDGNDQTFNYDFSPAFLGGCNMSGFSFGEGDSLWLDTYYKVTGNIGAKVQEVAADNRFYVSDIVNPTAEKDKYECDNYGDKFTLIGYEFKNEWKNNNTVNQCSKWISQSFYLGIGDCCSNYAGGNLFPYEYRSWGFVDQAKVIVPDNYDILAVRLKQTRTKFTNGTTTQTINDISIDSTSNDTLYFDLSQYYEGAGGSMLYSDDGFNGKLEIKLAPTCAVPSNTWENMPWWFKFQTREILGGEKTQWYDCNADRVRFLPATLALSSPAPTIDGLTPKASWTLKVKNNTSNTDSDNAWIHIQPASNDITILNVIDIDSGDTLSLSGDVYPVGQIKRSKTRQFQIDAIYGNCSPDYITVFSGYECAGYPERFADFTCPYSQMELHVEPKTAELQMRVSGITGGDICGSEANVSVEMASVQQAHVDSLYLVVSLPASGSITPKSGGATYRYPHTVDSVILNDPVLTDHAFRYNSWELSEDIEREGLPGILQTDKNRIRFRFDFDIGTNYSPGEYIKLSAYSKRPCGDDLPLIQLKYDPSIRFERTVSTGLDADERNTWGAAWGDYDGDGYEDILITEYAHWWASYLFHNNGDGTFSKVSAPPITSDKGSNVGATWGDYDNDGDLDLFIANNVRAENHLYRNEGNGNFSPVNAGEVTSYNGYCHSAAWVDYDNDGFLDLFVADYMPTRFNQLYHNEGDGTFTTAETSPIMLEAKSTMSASWGDYDNDGLVDLFVPNTQDDNNSLYHNDGNGKFTKITTGDIVTDGGNSLGASWGDVDNDGDLDLYVTNASNQANFFYINNGDGTFTRNTTSLIATETGHSFGSTWGDIDNDGDLDLFVTQDNDNQNRMYVNMGNYEFVIQNQLILNEDSENSAATALADYDNDGDLDIFVANNNYQVNTLYKNKRGQCNSWKCLKLVGNNSNRSAIGAKVRVKANIYGQDIWQMREISGQTGGVSAQNTLKVYFGLGDATQIDSMIIEWPSSYIQYKTAQSVSDCETIIEPDGQLISGVTFVDENTNCEYDEGEQLLPNIMLEILPDGKFITTNEQGRFEFYRGAGDYTIRQVDNNNWSHPCYQEIDVVITEEENNSQIGNTQLTGQSSNSSIIMPNQPGCDYPDLNLNLSSTVLRLGFRNTYAISYYNNGSEAAYDVDLRVVFDNDIVPLSADLPWDIVEAHDSTTSYIWQIDSILPYKGNTIMLIDSVSVNGTIGDMTKTLGYFEGSNNDCDPTDNTVQDFNEIVGAIDPNDILVYPEGSILATDTLTYKIRFQNIGTAPAQNVLVLDTLSPYLDPSTLEILAHSHDYKMVLDEHGVIHFKFDYIFLPDSNSNEPESHGFIQYKITPKASTPRGTKILNRAAIRFDFSEWLITNTVSNTIENVRELATENQLKVLVSPNPVEEVATLRLVSKTDPSVWVMIDSYKIYSSNGVQVSQVESIEQAEVQITRGNWAPGVYIIQLRDENGFEHSGKFVLK
ncbi:MAG: FG-GAP-like repeat-containing protein [Bacteroidota bacterium]